MHQTLSAPMDMTLEDFSFEVDQSDVSPVRPFTPISQNRRSTTPVPIPIQNRKMVFSQPSSVRRFELNFGYTNDSTPVITIEGVLIPLSNSDLVSPSEPINIPIVKLGQMEGCLITCPRATYPECTEPTSATEFISSTSETWGSFEWTDTTGQPILPHQSNGVKGDVHVQIRRGHWGTQQLRIKFPWPEQDSEVFFLLGPGLISKNDIRVVQASIGGTTLQRAVYGKSGSLVKVGLGLPAGQARNHRDAVAVVELEIVPRKGVVVLPTLLGEDHEGTMTIDQIGEGWNGEFPIIIPNYFR